MSCAAETFFFFFFADMYSYIWNRCSNSLLSLLPQLYVTITVTIIMLQIVYVTLVFPCDESICCCFLKYG